MKEVSSAEVQRNFSTYREIADGTRSTAEAVAVMHYNKPSVVIVSAEEYSRLKRRDKQSMAIEDLPDWLVQQIANGVMDPESIHLNETS